MAVEIVDIRHFGARDFQPVLAAESSAWTRALRWDYAASAKLISACLAEKRLSGYALVSEKQIHGYSFFVYEGEKGLIGDLFVQPDSAVRQNALLLLEHVIETLKATPGVTRIEAQLPHVRFDDLAPCFLQRGFQAYRRGFMALRLKNRPVYQPGPTVHPASERPQPRLVLKDILVDFWQRKHDAAAARLLAEVYLHHVDAAINDQYQSLSGAAKLIENIMQLRGCGENLDDASLVVIHRPTGLMAGVLAVTAVRPSTAHIPQIAVAPEHQRSGLGAYMLETAFSRLDRMGFEEVSLTVTDKNAGAVRFYERLGFVTFHTFGAFVWDVTGRRI
ncbi:MAG: GNAT family N-acetyltransferase [Terriglobia bacterium]